MNKKQIELIKEKDEEAFETLYNEYKCLVYYVIYQIVKNADATSRLLQDTFLTVYNKIYQYNGGNFKYWILTIAKNLAKNYVTRDLVKENHFVNDNERVEKAPDESYQGLGKYDEILSENFEQEAKDIIVYHIVFGYQFKDIAKIMDKTPRYVSTKYKLSLDRLKKIMEEL